MIRSRFTWFSFACLVALAVAQTRSSTQLQRRKQMPCRLDILTWYFLQYKGIFYCYLSVLLFLGLTSLTVYRKVLNGAWICNARKKKCFFLFFFKQCLTQNTHTSDTKIKFYWGCGPTLFLVCLKVLIRKHYIYPKAAAQFLAIGVELHNYLTKGLLAFVWRKGFYTHKGRFRIVQLFQSVIT